jgi:hypothetical protein
MPQVNISKIAMMQSAKCGCESNKNENINSNLPAAGNARQTKFSSPNRRQNGQASKCILQHKPVAPNGTTVGKKHAQFRELELKCEANCANIEISQPPPVKSCSSPCNHFQPPCNYFMKFHFSTHNFCSNKAHIGPNKLANVVA